MIINSRKHLIENVNARLREEWGISVISIPADRLRDEIRDAVAAGRSDCCVKIPSRSEFTLSLAEARAVLEVL